MIQSARCCCGECVVHAHASYYLFGVGRAGCGGGPLGLPTGIGLEKSGSGENGSAIVLPPFCDRVRLLLLAVDLRRDAYRRRKVLRVDHPCVLGI
jgi:hypothetical protein